MESASSHSAGWLTECSQALLLVAVIKIKLWREITVFWSCQWIRFSSGISFLGAIVRHDLLNTCFGILGKIPLGTRTHDMSKGKCLDPCVLTQREHESEGGLSVSLYKQNPHSTQCYSVRTTAQQKNSCECGVPQSNELKTGRSIWTYVILLLTIKCAITELISHGALVEEMTVFCLWCGSTSSTSQDQGIHWVTVLQLPTLLVTHSLQSKQRRQAKGIRGNRDTGVSHPRSHDWSATELRLEKGPPRSPLQCPHHKTTLPIPAWLVKAAPLVTAASCADVVSLHGVTKRVMRVSADNSGGCWSTEMNLRKSSKAFWNLALRSKAA